MHTNLSRYTVLVLTILCGWCSLARTAVAAEKPQRPNILFIYADDQSHRTVSCYPEAFSWVNTPNIDQLAKRGVRFTHAYIGTWCMPSRATMLTGHHQYGVESMRMTPPKYPASTYDPKQCRFWPSVFRKHGYTTAQIGKWHTGTDTGFGRDWDYQYVWNRPRYTDNAGNYFDEQLIEINGGDPQMVKGYTTDVYTERALEFLDGKHREDESPWYLWLCFGAVHAPFTPAERHLEAYPGAKITPPKDVFPPRAGKPEYIQKMERWVRGKDGVPEMAANVKQRTVKNEPIHGNTLNDWIRQYHQGVLAIDEAVGKLIKKLEETGQAENTLVVYTADQGFAWGQHGLRHKLAPYDAAIRSPLIFSMPGRIPEGKVCESAVSGVDIAPTFFGVADLELPWKMHGHDLAPLLENPAANWPHTTLVTLSGEQYGSNTNEVPTDPKVLYLAGVPWWVSIIDGDYKYIRTLIEGEVEELYDLRKDPGELDNLAVQSKHHPTVSRLREKMIAELKRTGAGFAEKMPRPSEKTCPR